MPLLRKLWKAPALWLSLCVAASFLLLAYPIYVIWPFRHQGHTELAVALAVLRMRIYFQVAFGASALGLAVWIWRRRERLIGRVFAVLAAVLTIGFGVLSGVNIYERMFHPMEQPVFRSAEQSKLDGAEQVIAIKVNTAARAYPIRIISYHHIVNDMLAGLPVVATY